MYRIYPNSTVGKDFYSSREAGVWIAIVGFNISYIASGAGIADVNGNYSEEGTHNSHPYYKHETNEQYIFWNSEYGPGWWIAYALDAVGPASEYYNGDGATPPLTDWQVSDLGSPAPTLSLP